MNLRIDLPAELEARLQEQAAARGLDPDRYLEEIVRERLELDVVPDRGANSAKDVRQMLREIIELHPPSQGGVDDSRDSIYSESA